VPRARELLDGASHELARAGVPTPRIDAELLLAHVTGRPRLELGLMGEVAPEKVVAFRGLVARRAAREPLQHLTGRAPFRHIELLVGPGAFVPRPETELLVDAAHRHVGTRSAPVLVDLCTGTGAIALSLAIEVPGARVHAVELSEEALAWARRNASSLYGEVAAAGSTVALHHADATTVAELGQALAPLVGTVDVVVTNPPYVPDSAVPRDPEVRDHDPDLALYGGPDGLDVIGPLAQQAALLLRPGGLLLVEHADAQGEDAGALGVPALLRAQGEPGAAEGAPGGLGAEREAQRVLGNAGAGQPAWRAVADHFDLAGRPRYTSAVRAGQDRPR
jgi:release factor glutamine methyltransferase